MESSSYLSKLPLRKTPRQGQIDVFEHLESTDKNSLNIKLPTGYGKTFTALVCYGISIAKLRCNRLLIVFPTKDQIDQFVQDATCNLKDAGLYEPYRVVDIRDETPARLLQLHLSNKSYVYVTTIQALRLRVDVINTLMQKGRWFICVDEYHHYGEEKDWGLTIRGLNYDFLLAMSATPYRKDDDSAFGPPDVEISYREGVKQQALKPLKGHSYIYKIDTLNDEGDVVSYTTNELVAEAGGDPDSIEKWKITRKIRWSPKYVSPLVSIPIERMIRMRLETGRKLQAIISAFCVSHAEMVCEQVKALFPELRVDWVGTGENGRPIEVNDKVRKQFCPPKDEHGERTATLDVLVHVGKAGEGLDSSTITEVCHLHQKNINNKEIQEDGRTSRVLLDLSGNVIEGHINFDSTSEFALKGYVGRSIMDAMDSNPPQNGDDDEKERSNGEYKEIPEWPSINIFDVSLLRIDSGTEGVQRMAETLGAMGLIKNLHQLNCDLNHPGWDEVIMTYRNMRAKEAESHNEKAIVLQWQESVGGAMSHITGLVVSKLIAKGAVFEKSLLGDIKKKVSARKAKMLGKVCADVEVYKKHYAWIKSLETEILENGVPSWLM